MSGHRSPLQGTVLNITRKMASGVFWLFHLFIMPYRRSYSGKKTYRRSASRTRSVARSGGQYRKAAKQLDGSRFVIMAQQGGATAPMGLTIAGNQSMSPPLHLNALTALIASDMGQQICSMYDEFRIRSCKCKIYPTIANTFTSTGQFQLHTAWDRNGSLQIFYPTESDGK